MTPKCKTSTQVHAHTSLVSKADFRTMHNTPLTRACGCVILLVPFWIQHGRRVSSAHADVPIPNKCVTETRLTYLEMMEPGSNRDLKGRTRMP
jgi:hypothetical protein